MVRNIDHFLYNHWQCLRPLQLYVYYYRHLLIANNDILQVFVATYHPYQLHQPESEPQFKAKYFYTCFFRYIYILSRAMWLGFMGELYQSYDLICDIIKRSININNLDNQLHATITVY